APLARRAPEVPGPSAEPRPILVRVGLASDLASFSLPCCQRSLVIEASAARTPLDEDLNVAPGSVGVASGSFRLQVAALRDEAAAAALAERLARRTGQPADSFYDAGVDLYRVRLGRYPGRPEAEAARRSLGADAAGAWLVEERSEGAGEAGFAFNLRRGGATESVPGRFLALASAGGEPIAYQGRRYRGRLVLFLNDRGGLNLINELPLEDYLRGVVPMEMGPEVYGRLEALKAQAVAARTYTLANLGQFAAEGFDLCASPRCQVYGGQSAEHPLSDRAVAETADQVLIYQGQPIEALYTASCGGHTEDVHVVFPAKNQAYLKGVPCEEAGAQTLASSLPPGSPFPYALAIELVPAL
ncbi:MAG TPA: SpoIID/LytB domain-containing protein, partial [Thermoanaerobaculia bacterium]|nr:SpoIID/LytB domain-containing protein [Thermoanaerobaculia bacterium]